MIWVSVQRGFIQEHGSQHAGHRHDALHRNRLNPPLHLHSRLTYLALRSTRLRPLVRSILKRAYGCRLAMGFDILCIQLATTLYQFLAISCPEEPGISHPLNTRWQNVIGIAPHKLSSPHSLAADRLVAIVFDAKGDKRAIVRQHPGVSNRAA